MVFIVRGRYGSIYKKSYRLHIVFKRIHSSIHYADHCKYIANRTIQYTLRAGHGFFVFLFFVCSRLDIQTEDKAKKGEAICRHTRVHYFYYHCHSTIGCFDYRTGYLISSLLRIF